MLAQKQGLQSQAMTSRQALLSKGSTLSSDKENKSLNPTRQCSSTSL
jgi:hypothetical protein